LAAFRKGKKIFQRGSEKRFLNSYSEPLLLHQTIVMDYQSEFQQEYQEELQKVHDRDFTHNWVSSSAFLFYLQVACILAMVLGGCYMLYTKRYTGHPDVSVPENTLYTPKYK
jgi:hypothetical protein